MTIKVYLDSVRASSGDECSEGTRLVVIGEVSTLAFEGEAWEAAGYLRHCVPVGQSVAVRHAGGIRSCMNKPGLWRDVLEYQA